MGVQTMEYVPPPPVAKMKNAAFAIPDGRCDEQNHIAGGG
jgi:hypothetical protein